MIDPMEEIVANALDRAGVHYVREQRNPAKLDFFLPSHGVHIEVKRFYTSRIVDQMARADNVIAIQGIEAARFFASMACPTK